MSAWDVPLLPVLGPNVVGYKLVTFCMREEVSVGFGHTEVKPQTLLNTLPPFFMELITQDSINGNKAVLLSVGFAVSNPITTKLLCCPPPVNNINCSKPTLLSPSWIRHSGKKWTECHAGNSHCDEWIPSRWEAQVHFLTTTVFILFCRTTNFE